MESEYRAPFICTDNVVKNYWKNGYIMIRGLFNQEEIDNLKRQIFEQEAFNDKIYERGDGTGTTIKMVLWRHPGHDVSGLFARCEKLTGIVEKVLGDEVYHYHSKIMMKEAQTGGTFQWHQDFGYWYNMGVLFPDDLLTVFVPVDKCTRNNGCLQLLPGSHKLGRLNHGLIEEQQAADPERMKLIIERFPPVHAVMDPGDALIFHSNVLHTSSRNESNDRRYAYLMCYNTKSNDPVVMDPCPTAKYTPLEKVPDSCVADCTNYTDLSGKNFFCPTGEQL